MATAISAATDKVTLSLFTTDDPIHFPIFVVK
jgi:hypothetical protein